MAQGGSQVNSVEPERVRDRIAGIEEFLQALERPVTKLRVCFNFEQVKMERIQQLALLLKNHKTLISLNMGNSLMRADQTFVLIQSICRNTSLHHLNFEKNVFSGLKSDTIAHLLDTTNTVISLNIEATQLSSGSLAKIFQSLKANKTLMSLCIAYLDIGTAFRDLGEALQSNSTLTYLDLSGTIRNEQEVKWLTIGLSNNKSIKKLIAWENALEDSKAAVLCDSLRNNQSVSTLELCYNKIGGLKSAESISKMLRHNKSLTSIRLDFNYISDNEREQIANALITNTKIVAFVMDESESDIHAELNEVISSTINRNKLAQKRAFYEALSSDVKQPWNRSKLMLIGEGQAGKTATVRSLLNKKFDPEWKSTIGITVTEANTASTETWLLNNNDADYTTSFLNRAALKNLEQANYRKKSMDYDLSEEHFIDVAARIETENELTTVSEDSTDEVREYNERLFIETSSTNGEDSIEINIWDYGGQVVFQNLHHLFLSDYGLYLLVINLKALLKQPKGTMQSVLFWLNSVRIHTLQAPLLIVGTFCNDLTSKEIRKAQETLTKLLSDRFRRLREGISREIIPIDNRTGFGIEKLRSVIEHVIRKQDYIYLKISIIWMQVLDALVQTGESWLHYDDARVIANKIQHTSLEEMDNMLGVFHELGVIIHFQTTVSLKDIITLKPQWLIDSISEVIRDGKIHPYKESILKDNNLVNDVNRLFDDGMATRDLLEVLWNKSQVEFLLDLMRSLLLISDWKYDNEEMTYLVPCMLARKSLDMPVIQGSEFSIEFEYLFTGVYARLVCLLVDYCSRKEVTKQPLLRKDGCVLFFKDDFVVSLRSIENRISGVIDNISYASTFLAIVIAMIDKIKSEVMGEKFVYHVKVEIDGKMVPYNTSVKNGRNVWTRKFMYTRQRSLGKSMDSFMKL